MTSRSIYEIFKDLAPTLDNQGRVQCSNCGKRGGGSLFRCGTCKVDNYCSKEYQLDHWKAAHKKVCKTKKAAREELDGRVNKPACWGSGCSRAADVACGRCRAVYCSEDCQKADWKKHKKVCEKMGEDSAAPDAREMERMRKFQENYPAFLHSMVVLMLLWEERGRDGFAVEESVPTFTLEDLSEKCAEPRLKIVACELIPAEDLVEEMLDRQKEKEWRRAYVDSDSSIPIKCVLHRATGLDYTVFAYTSRSIIECQTLLPPRRGPETDVHGYHLVRQPESRGEVLEDPTALSSRGWPLSRLGTAWVLSH